MLVITTQEHNDLVRTREIRNTYLGKMLDLMSEEMRSRASVMEVYHPSTPHYIFPKYPLEMGRKHVTGFPVLKIYWIDTEERPNDWAMPNEGQLPVGLARAPYFTPAGIVFPVVY